MNKENKKIYPAKFELSQNYPNPFNMKTIIEYTVSLSGGERGGYTFVDLSIYNILGQKVVTLLSEKQKSGTHKVEWNADGYSSGIYLYRIETISGNVKTRKLVLLK